MFFRTDNPRILICMPSDPLQALDALGFLCQVKHHVPRARIDVIAEDAIKPLARMCTAIDVVMSFMQDDKTLFNAYTYGKHIANLDYQCVFLLSTKRYHRVSMMFTGIPLSIGWIGWKWWRWPRMRCQQGDWQALYRLCISQQQTQESQGASAYVFTLMPQMHISSTDSASSAKWLGIKKLQTVAVACHKAPPNVSWIEVVSKIRALGFQILWCGIEKHHIQQALTEHKQLCGYNINEDIYLQSKYYQPNYSLYCTEFLQALPMMVAVLCANTQQQRLIDIFSVQNYCMLTDKPVDVLHQLQGLRQSSTRIE